MNKHNLCERAKELSDMQLSISHAHTDLNTGVSDIIERCCLPKNTLEQLIIINLYMSLLIYDVKNVCVSEFWCQSVAKSVTVLVKSSVTCESQQLLSTKRDKVYKVSAWCAHLISADIKKTAELKSDVNITLLTIIDCKKIIKSESYKEVIWDVVHESY